MKDLTETQFFQIPRIWSKPAFIIGGGGSLDGFDFTKLEGKNTIGCNYACRLGEKIVKVLLFGDISFYDDKNSSLSTFRNLAISNHESFPIWGVHEENGFHVCNRTLMNMTDKDTDLCWYWNTGLMAIELAAKMGSKTIYCLGFDFKKKGDTQLNWYPKEWVKRTPQEIVLAKNVHDRSLKYVTSFNDKFKALFPDVKVINANPDSLCDTWEKQPWSDKWLTE